MGKLQCIAGIIWRSLETVFYSVSKREENEIFKLYQQSDSAEDLDRLARLMLQHATAVTYLVFRQRREDVAQEAVIKGLAALKAFRGDSLFSTWFHSVTLNHCRDSLRKEIVERVTVELREEELSKVEPDWLTRLSIEEIVERLDTEDQRFVRDKLEGRVEDELVEKYGLSPEGIRSRWFAIKKRIRENLG